MVLGCNEVEHAERAKRYPFCFICGLKLREAPLVSQYPPCPVCGETTYVGWQYCGWCGVPLERS